MVKGWQKVDQHWKYYNPEAYNGCPEGSMRKSAWVGNYYVGDDGIMLTSQWVDSGRYYVNENGLWVQAKWVKTNNKWWIDIRMVVIQQMELKLLEVNYIVLIALGI